MIQGLTDKGSLTPRLPRLGKLRKGGAKQEKNGKSVFGKDLEYFRFTSENPAVVSAFTKEYHEQPNNLHVFMPFATRDECFPTWKEAWDASTLLHRCDGRTCEIWWDAQRKVYSREPKPCPGGCKEVGRLEVVLPELFRSGFVGTVTMETHGKNDMMAIASCLDKVEIERTEHGLDLRGVGFILRRHNESISTPGWGTNEGKRQRVVKSLVSLEPVAAWAEKVIALADGAKPAEIAATSSFAVKDGRTIDTGTGEVLDAFDDDDEIEDGDFTPQADLQMFLAYAFERLEAAQAIRAQQQADEVQELADAAHARCSECMWVVPNHAPECNAANGNEAPTCPKCKGPMWDNRQKIADTGKKLPLWSCKAGKWNAETKQKEGCDGVIWPPKDGEAPNIPVTPIVVKRAAPPIDMSAEPMLTAEDEFERMESASEAVMITKAQIKDLGILANQVYGHSPADLEPFRRWMVANYGVDTRTKLTARQAADMTEKLKDALAKQGEKQAAGNGHGVPVAA